MTSADALTTPVKIATVTTLEQLVSEEPGLPRTRQLLRQRKLRRPLVVAPVVLPPVAGVLVVDVLVAAVGIAWIDVYDLTMRSPRFPLTSPFLDKLFGIML